LSVGSWPKIASWPSELSVSFGENRRSSPMKQRRFTNHRHIDQNCTPIKFMELIKQKT
jgi:hypothetical protein